MHEPTFKEIIEARNKCAQVIALYGERYLPIFRRLENEISKREEERILIEKAICISNKNGTQNDTHNGTQIRNKILRITKIFNKNSVLQFLT